MDRGMPSTEFLFGPMLIGVFLNTILYGVLVVQTFNYYQVYKSNDKARIRYLIIYLFVLETLNTAFDIEMMYDLLIRRNAKPIPPGPPDTPPMLSADAIVTVLISTPVQFFLAWRIRVLADSRFIAAIIILLGIASFGGGVATTVLVTLMPNFSKFNNFYPAIITWLASSAVADILITGSLVRTLNHKRTGMKATDDVVNKIIRLTVQTGMITAVFAVADFVLALTVRGKAFNFIPDFALSKLYTNSLIASLNARADFEAALNNPDNLLFRSKRDKALSMSIHFSDRSRQTQHTTIDGASEYPFEGRGYKRDIDSEIALSAPKNAMSRGSMY